MLVSLANRLAFVTGGGSGIGQAVCYQLSRAGANVMVVDRNADSARATATFINTNIEAAGLGGRAAAYGLDVTKMNEISQAIAHAQDHFDSTPLSLGVHCAGITKDMFMSKMTEADWDAVLNVNLKGTFLCTKAVAHAISANQAKNPALLQVGGSIVNIASIIGKTGNLGQANYAASKGGVIAFSKTAAKELARNRIRVNAVLPGFIATPMANAVPDKVKEKMIQQIPLGAFGEPQDIADMCTFLCSDRAKYVTGSVIEVTGGFCM
jgi:NAD(P)-dependent dehydrogenase (short-subunit alcohol dehydrogenase family)